MSLIGNKGKNFPIPHTLQGLAIHDFASRKNYKIIYNVIRQAKDGEFLFFDQRLNELPDVRGFIAYSSETLGNIFLARSYLEKMIKKNYVLWLVTENFLIENYNDIDKLEDSYVIKKISKLNSDNFDQIYDLIH